MVVWGSSADAFSTFFLLKMKKAVRGGRRLFILRGFRLGPGYLPNGTKLSTVGFSSHIMSSFRFQGRYALLTYSQCGQLDPFDVVNHLSAIPAECIIGREAHSDGGTHLHAFVDFGTKYRTRDPRRFDVAGCHPNIQPCGRTPEKMFDYAIKDGDIVAGGLERPCGDGVSAADDTWHRILDAEDADSFWELVRTLAPRLLLTNFNSLRSYCEWHYRPTMAPYVSPSGIMFDISGVEELGQFVRESLSGTHRGKLKNMFGSAGEGWSSGNSGAPPAPDPSPQPAPCDY